MKKSTDGQTATIAETHRVNIIMIGGAGLPFAKETCLGSSEENAGTCFANPNRLLKTPFRVIATTPKAREAILGLKKSRTSRLGFC